jgi:hypothetical protein
VECLGCSWSGAGEGSPVDFPISAESDEDHINKDPLSLDGGNDSVLADAQFPVAFEVAAKGPDELFGF